MNTNLKLTLLQMTCRNISWTQGRKADLICLKFVIVLYNKINFYQLLAAGTNNSPKREINGSFHYTDVIMGMIASQITSLTTIYSDADQRKYQSSASLAFVSGFHRRPVNSPHKGPITQKMFPFDDVIIQKVWLDLCNCVAVWNTTL